MPFVSLLFDMQEESHKGFGYYTISVMSPELIASVTKAGRYIVITLSLSQETFVKIQLLSFEF